MTEVEKLYENAEIKGEWRDYRVKNGKVYEGRNPKNRNIRLCKPKFTAEKQLKIIMNFDNFEMLFEKSEYLLFISCPPNRYHSHDKKFEIALAKLINTIWQDLTVQEQQQIKEILQ